MKSLYNITGTQVSGEFTIKVYYFSMTDKIPEGPIEVVESMNGINKPVQITNYEYDDEVSRNTTFLKDLILEM